MKCPHCQHEDLAVLEKRDIEGGVRRRRVCNNCQHRFTTYERPEVPQLVVVKKDGSREQYDEEKVRLGMEMACKNRPLHPAQISQAAAEVTQVLRAGEQDAVSSNQIGDLVLARLRQLDQIAYLRFVSVHHSFPDLESFKKEIQRLEKITNKEVLWPKPKPQHQKHQI